MGQMHLANQVAGFFNWLYLQNKMMNKPDFLFVDIEINENQKVIEKPKDGKGQKWVWLRWSKDTKIGCISRRNQWNKLIFGMLWKIQESQKLRW